jgi:hypothetical protein
MPDFLDHWEARNDKWTTSAPGHRRHFIEETEDGWNLWTRGPSLEFYWFSNSLEDLGGVVASTDAFWKRHDEAGKRKATITTELQGLKATASFERGHFDVQLWSKDGEVALGRYFGGLNNALSGFVLEELTIQGSRYLDESQRGRGLGAGLIDIAEQVTGLRAVPHGHMGTTGSASESALKSWQSRRRMQGVPGMEQRSDVDARAALLPEIEARRGLRFDSDSYDRGLAIADSLGLGLTTVSFPDTGFSFFPKFKGIEYAYATRSDGSVITGIGADSIEAAIANSLRLDASDKAVADASVSFIEESDVVKAISDRQTPEFYQEYKVNDLALAIIKGRETRRSHGVTTSCANSAVSKP